MNNCQFCNYSNSDFYVFREHVAKHYKDTNLKLKCERCCKTKPITEFRLFRDKCRLCTYLYRYRFGKTKNIWNEYLQQINANFCSVPQET